MTLSTLSLTVLSTDPPPPLGHYTCVLLLLPNAYMRPISLVGGAVMPSDLCQKCPLVYL